MVASHHYDDVPDSCSYSSNDDKIWDLAFYTPCLSLALAHGCVHGMMEKDLILCDL